MRFTTLVPAYKPQYLIELLTALRHQTVKPAKVIFSDDSPGQSFLSALNADPLRSLIADLNVEVIPGPRCGGYNNFRFLLKRYQAQARDATELFHLLLDDDLIYPNFYEQHLQAHQNAKLPCVISRRWAALESGQPIRDDLPVPVAIASHPYRQLVLDANTLFAQTVGASRNWLGEFSNVTFRAFMAPELVDTTMAGVEYSGLEDLGGFLKASLHGPIGYINSFLGSFRLSAAQNSANPMGRPLKLAFLAYLSLAIAGRQLGHLGPEQAAISIRHTCAFILQHYQKEVDMADFCALLPRLSAGELGAEADFLKIWSVYSVSPILFT
jgi:hypothetical protein